jgi:hypothetical protein
MILAYISYALRYRTWPSRLQRLHMQGDPTGEVRRVADQIIAEIEADDQST